MKIHGYYFITDSALSKAGNLSDVRNALKAGVQVVQYRNKTGTTPAMLEEALALKRICAGKVIFLINDRIDIAIAVNADGIHLGQDDIPCNIARKSFGKNKIIGVTVRNLKEAIHAQKLGCDYVALAPVFKTGTKPDAGKPAGLKTLREIKKKLSIPVVAIGGINLFNAPEVVNTGADALCAISSVVSSTNVKSEILKFQKIFKRQSRKAGRVWRLPLRHGPAKL